MVYLLNNSNVLTWYPLTSQIITLNLMWLLFADAYSKIDNFVLGASKIEFQIQSIQADSDVAIGQ